MLGQTLSIGFGKEAATSVRDIVVRGILERFGAHDPR
jgi:hypothetical protein